MTYSGVATHVAVAQRRAEIVADNLQHAHLHSDELVAIERVLGHVDEVVDQRRAALLKEKYDSKRNGNSHRIWRR